MCLSVYIWYNHSRQTNIYRTSQLSYNDIFTMLLRNWLSKKWAATCAGSKLYKILLFDSCNTAISRFSCDACSCHRKSRRAVHSTCRPCANIAIIKMMMRANETVCNGMTDLWPGKNNRKVLKLNSPDNLLHTRIITFENVFMRQFDEQRIYNAHHCYKNCFNNNWKSEIWKIEFWICISYLSPFTLRTQKRLKRQMQPPTKCIVEVYTANGCKDLFQSCSRQRRRHQQHQPQTEEPKMILRLPQCWWNYSCMDDPINMWTANFNAVKLIEKTAYIKVRLLPH